MQLDRIRNCKKIKNKKIKKERKKKKNIFGFKK